MHVAADEEHFGAQVYFACSWFDLLSRNYEKASVDGATLPLEAWRTQRMDSHIWGEEETMPRLVSVGHHPQRKSHFDFKIFKHHHSITGTSFRAVGRTNCWISTPTTVNSRSLDVQGAIEWERGKKMVSKPSFYFSILKYKYKFMKFDHIWRKFKASSRLARRDRVSHRARQNIELQNI